MSRPLIARKTCGSQSNFPAREIADAYESFGSRADGVLKIAIKPSRTAAVFESLHWEQTKKDLGQLKMHVHPSR